MRAIIKQVNDYINKCETLVNIINYLFTCDCSVNEIINTLTAKPFNFQKQLIIDVLKVDFDIEITPFIDLIK